MTHFRGRGSVLIVYNIQSFQKFFVSPFVKSTPPPPPNQDSHMQIFCGNPYYVRVGHVNLAA